MNFSLSNYWRLKQEQISIAKLKKAMSNQQLQLYFLPVVSIQDEKTIELEALLRWPIEGDTYIAPMKFIPFAEQNGLMPELTRWVIGQLLSLMRVWQQSGIDINWSMNLSPSDLRDTTLISDLTSELKNNHINQSRLGIEVSHSIVRTASTECLDFLVNMRSQGMRLILDNYELNNSQDELALPELWNAIKIDRKMIMELRSKPENIQSIKQFCEDDRYQNIICAPGINSYYEWQQIQPLNCHQAQGFYLSPPQSAHDTQLWLQLSKWGKHTDSHIDAKETTGALA